MESNHICNAGSDEDADASFMLAAISGRSSGSKARMMWKNVEPHC
jgi:hypothetical protein